MKRRLLLGALLSLGSGAGQAACLLEPSAWIVDSVVLCESPFGTDLQVDAQARVVNATLSSGTLVGERSQVLSSRLSNVQLGNDSHVVGADLGSPELLVILGDGAIVEQNVRMHAAQVGSNARLMRGAQLNGGRGIDFIRIGDNLIVENGADIKIRSLGDNALIGSNAIIGESTNAGNNFSIGNNSVWVVGGSAGDDVVIDRNVRIEGGVELGSGVNIGANSLVGFSVSIGDYVNIENSVLLGNMVAVGANTLLRRGVSVGNGVTIGAGAMLRRNVLIGDNASIGAGSIIDANASVPIGTTIPANSFVSRNGSIIPKP